MAWIITKYMLTAAVVALISEAAKRSDKLGGFIGALPLVTLLALIWLCVEKQPQAKIANHAWYTFWYVVPTLPMFLVFPYLLSRIGFCESPRVFRRLQPLREWSNEYVKVSQGSPRTFRSSGA